MKRNRSLDIVFSPRSKILFYPSCGHTNIRPGIFDLDYDLFIFSDQIVENLKDNNIAKMALTEREQASFNQLHKHFKKINEIRLRPFYNSFIHQLHFRPPEKYGKLDAFHTLVEAQNYKLFRFKRKIGILFHWDNNITLAYLREKEAEIHALVGINDGCMAVERDRYQMQDNYECVNSGNWLKRVAALAPKQGLLHITDHFPEEKELDFAEYGLKAQRIKYEDWQGKNGFVLNPFPSFMCPDEGLKIHQIKLAHRQR